VLICRRLLLLGLSADNHGLRLAYLSDEQQHAVENKESTGLNGLNSPERCTVLRPVAKFGMDGNEKVLEVLEVLGALTSSDGIWRFRGPSRR